MGHRQAVDGQKIIKIKIFRKKYITSGKTNFGLNMMFTGRYTPRHLQNAVKNIVFEAKISQKWLKFGHGAQVIGRRLAVYGQKIIKIKIFRKKYKFSGKRFFGLIMMFTDRYRPHHFKNHRKSIFPTEILQF